jgi:hypothetical protein
MHKQKLINVLNGTSVVLGVTGFLAPAAMQRSFGGTPTNATSAATRMVSTRNLVLSALAYRLQREASGRPAAVRRDHEWGGCLRGLRGRSGPR